MIGDNHKGETLYGWGNTLPYVWKGFGNKETQLVYKGEWKNEKLNGLGVMTYPDGHKYVGGWKDGKIWKGTHFDKDGNVIGKFVNGKEIKQ